MVITLKFRIDVSKKKTYQNHLYTTKIYVEGVKYNQNFSHFTLESNMLSISLSRQFSNEDVKELLLENIANVHVSDDNWLFSTSMISQYA